MNAPDDTSIWREALSPSDWAFVSAFPNTELEFRRAFPYSEFLSQFESWSEYRKHVADPFGELILPMAEAGMSLLTFASLRDFRNSVSRCTAIVLFSHCNPINGAIEFRDGMIPREQVAAQVSSRFKGIIDLSVCNPRPDIIDLFKRRSANCSIALTEDELTPLDWLTYYGFFLSRFLKGEASYFSAAEEAREKFAGVAKR
jgi:hypothetical protein